MSRPLQRFTPVIEPHAHMLKTSRGEWVMFRQHMSVVKKLQREIERLKRKIP